MHLKSFVSYRSFVSDHSYCVRYNIYSSSLQWKIQWIFLRVFLKTFSVALHDIGHHCKIRFWNNTWEYFGKPFWIDQLINKSRSQCVSLNRTHMKSQVCCELIGYYSWFIDDNYVDIAYDNLLINVPAVFLIARHCTHEH